MNAILDPIAEPRQRMHEARSALRGTNDMDAYAQMFADYLNELNAIRMQILANAEKALASGHGTAAEFAQDALEDVARIDAEMGKLDPR